MNQNFMDFLEDTKRLRAFQTAKSQELRAEGYEVTNIFDLPNVDEFGSQLCAVDDIVIGFEVSKDGEMFNHFYGAMTLLFWDKFPLLDRDATDEEIETMHPITTVTSSVEGCCVHIQGDKGSDLYKAIFERAKELEKEGKITKDRLRSAARRYILAVQHACELSGEKAPRLSLLSLEVL